MTKSNTTKANMRQQLAPGTNYSSLISYLFNKWSNSPTPL